MTTATKLTLAQFLAMEETKPASELIDGEVIQKPMPTQAHSFLQGYLVVILHQFLTRTRIGRAGPEWRCIFGPAGAERPLVPDITYVAREHLTRDRHHLAPPDLAVEILSPEQSASRVAEKITFYLRHGVRLIWVLDPELSTITVFTPDADARILGVSDTLDGGSLLPGFIVSVAEVFAQMEVDTGADLG